MGTDAGQLAPVGAELVGSSGEFWGELSKAGTPAIFGPNTLVFRFPASYNQTMEYVEQSERLARIEEALRRITGKSLESSTRTRQGSPGCRGTDRSRGYPGKPRAGQRRRQRRFLW